MQQGVCAACGVQAPPAYAFPQALPVGTELASGKFKVGYVLGTPGGFGIAYRGYQENLRRFVVIKELFPDQLVSRNVIETGSSQVVISGNAGRRNFSSQKSSFIEEARKVAFLQGNNTVVGIIDHFSENGTAYIVMPFIDGRSIKDSIAYEGRMEIQKVISIFRTVAEGLQKVHEHGLIHRDIKPDNVLLLKGGDPILIDFGNAVSQVKLSELCQSGELGFCGYSKWYGAPEQHGGGSPCRMGPASDVYAMCALLYFMLSGKNPTDAEERMSGVALVPLSGDNEEVSGLNRLISKGMALQASERFQSVSELLIDLVAIFPTDPINIWTEFLPTNAFGQRMRKMHELVVKGKPFPVHWNGQAALTQWFWFFGHGIALPGWGLTLFVAFLTAFGMLNGVFVPLLVLALLVGALFSGGYADALWYRHIASSVAEFKTGSSAELKSALSSMSKARPGPALMGMAVPVVLLMLVLLQSSRQETTRDHVFKAVTEAPVDTTKQAFEDFYEKHQTTPTQLSDLGVEFVPNSQLKDMVTVSNRITLTLALVEVSGRRIDWEAQPSNNGRIIWRCKNFDVPIDFIPDICR
ncbi:MAG: protein kinase [Hydrogenophaga sp.]|nr:protein kinase [Hydrogenophaga sp.]